MCTRRLTLYYWKGGNFGDDLNPWLWRQFLPDVVNSDDHSQDLESVNWFAGRDTDSDLFVGIGTLLNQRIPKENRKVVFGSGVGYGTPEIDNKYDIAFVRGPLSAKQIGNGTEYITDPALLTRKIVRAESVDGGKTVLIPHHSSIGSVDWKKLCDEAEIEYIDPTQPLEQTLVELSRAKLVLAEAMHGAIVADAIGIPWIPVNLHSHIHEFKWKDWCASVGLEYEPVGLPRGMRLISRRVNRFVDNTLIAPINYKIVLNVIKKAAKNGRTFLSREALRDKLLERLEDKLVELRRRFAAGRLWI